MQSTKKKKDKENDLNPKKGPGNVVDRCYSGHDDGRLLVFIPLCDSLSLSAEDSGIFF